MSEFVFRMATPKDTALLLQFIKDLAVYERMENEVVADEATLNEWIFEKKTAEVMFALVDGVEVAFAVFFQSFSTFVGRGGLHLEDVFVKPAFRGRGIGKAILKELAAIATARGYGRMEWTCLDWNESSIDFYLGLGATPMSEWTTYRMSGEALSALAAGADNAFLANS